MSPRLLLLSLMIASLSFTAPSRANEGKMAPDAVQASPDELRKKALDDLFKRLREAPDPDAAAPVRAAIEKLWAHTGSPTANLLMARAESLLKAEMGAQAASLLDRIVQIYPDWSLAWRRRAQSALIQGDGEGAMLDLDHALTIDPRNFLVMSDLATLMSAEGRNEPALQILRRALDFDPQNEDLRKAADQLQRQVEGQRI